MEHSGCCRISDVQRPKTVTTRPIGAYKSLKFEGSVVQMSGHKTAYNRSERGQSGVSGGNACGITVQSSGHGLSTIGLGLGHFGAEHIRCEVARIEARVLRRGFSPSYFAEYHPKAILEGGEYMTVTLNGRPQGVQAGEWFVPVQP